MNEQDDYQIIQKIVAGEHDLFQVIVDRYKNLVFSIALRSLHNYEEAEDLAQESFLRAFRFIHTYKPAFKFSTWISRIVINLYRDSFKKGKLLISDSEELETKADEKNNPEIETLRNIKREDIVSIIRRLDEKYQEVVMLYFFDEFSYDEIGTILGIPMGTVKSRLNRAKVILHDEYGKQLKKWREI